MKKKPSLSHHVVHNLSGGWDVKRGSGEQASLHFDTKTEAVTAGRKVSQHQETEFFIHGKDGRIQTKDSHGKDSKSPKV